MARRKRQLLDDDSDSSPVSDADDFHDPNFDHNDPDAREERALFENPYKHKRRRKNDKEDALYGVFGSEDEGIDSGRRIEGDNRRRKDWTKAPAFVSGEKVDMEKTTDLDAEMEGVDSLEEDEGKSMDGAGEESDDIAEEDDGEANQSGRSRPPSPRIREEEEEEAEEKPRFGGLGASKSASFGTFSGLSRGGIGMSSKPSEPSSPSVSPAPSSSISGNFPSTFGASRTQNSFLRNGGSGSSTPTPVLSAQERLHFSKIGGSFGARMLAKMGWQAGTGLGTAGEGIVTPVESRLRPKGMGLAFKGFKEKTEQSKAEARRRGEAISDEEEDERAARKGRRATKAQEERAEAWKKPKKVKTKVEHKTYEQIIAEAGQEPPQAGLGQIIDATGATPREVASLADVSLASWTPTADPMRLPEVRHNLRLITEACKNDLDGLAREARSIEERKKWILMEDARLRKRVEEEAALIERLQQVHLVVNDINSQARELSTMYEASLEPFSAHFEKLLGQFSKEFERYRLDEVIVAAIAPIIRRILAQWQPLEEPLTFTQIFRSWKGALRMTVQDDRPQDRVQVYGSSTIISTAPIEEKPMTPYESLLWNAWLPKVRSSINNEWSPDDPQPVVRLYEAWSSYLPPFIRDNFFDQLVLPKVAKAVADWNPRTSEVTLQTLVFPWLPHIGLRLDDLLSDARRKVKSLLRGWTVGEGMPKDLKVWKDVFDAGDWDTMLLKYVVPKLGSRLRGDFRVNPRSQDMKPLQDVLLWEDLLRPTILSQLLETEFFPKWLDVLHIWLIQPAPNFEEVVQWYSFWKAAFSENVQNLPGVAQGFTRGLQLMNKAIELGPDAQTRLPRPDHRAPPSGTTTPKAKQPPAKARPARAQEITFKSIVEEYASVHNLLFVPTGRAHEKSRMPLFRVSPTADGKGGLLVYILDDAVWAPDGDEYRAISLEVMVRRATEEN
ncbi:uncharacterized protein FIBRA_08442 [Fibroporia radiculosa]|uniref:G-patch domain-containing protein n=1 Tax=Fibroporia radiculosa TaxID=599839 RepID=J4H565_9APHY|nr:uncharacterized protein FIBRA_08442 [Fibroporia radiculosa]CCM06199.1 predicted protein [Fibroporia radiculosa]